jgi:threonine-phosphate decarboxylase
MTSTGHGGDVFDAARRLNVPLSELIDFSASINPLGISSRAIRRLKREVDLARHYPDRAQQELRELIATRHRIDPRCILFGNGATQLLHLIPRCLKPGKALLLAPGFSEYCNALLHERCRIYYYSLKAKNKFQLQVARFLQSIPRSIEMIVLANPNNPTGQLLGERELNDVVEYCGNRGHYLLVDESFLDFTAQRSLSRLASRSDHLIVVRSLTKFYALAGLRIGYVVASRPLIRNFATRLEPWSVNSLALVAAAESVRDTEYQKRSLDWIQHERSRLLSELQRLAWLEPFPSQTNFLLVEIKHPSITGRQLQRALEKNRILIRDSAGFHGLGPQFIRLAVRNHRENQLLITSLQAFEKRCLPTNGVQRY